MLEPFIANWKLRDLIRKWTTFHQVVMASRGAADVAPEQERRFLDLKASIAGRLPVLTTAVPLSLAPEALEEARQMTEMLNRFRTLKTEAPPAAGEKAEFDRLWHRHFIFLNKLKGAPLAHKPFRVVGRTGATPTGMPRHRIHRSIPGAHLLGFVVRAGIVFLFIYVLGRAFGLRWEPGGRLGAEVPANAPALGSNVGGALASVWGGVIHFMDPVVAAYGPVITLVFVGIVLLGIGYWVFVRG